MAAGKGRRRAPVSPSAHLAAGDRRKLKELEIYPFTIDTFVAVTLITIRRQARETKKRIGPYARL
jgi:hypothetical protein